MAWWKGTWNWRKRRQSNFTTFPVLGWMITNSRRKIWNQLENYQQFAHTFFYKVCILHELVDQTFYVQWTNLLYPAQNGHKLVMNDWQDWHHTFVTQETIVNVAMREMQHKHCRLGLFQDSDLAGDFEDSKKINIRRNLMYIRMSYMLFLLVGCVRSRHQCLTVPQNRKLLHWMLDCERMDYLPSICGMWW